MANKTIYGSIGKTNQLCIVWSFVRLSQAHQLAFHFTLRVKSPD